MKLALRYGKLTGWARYRDCRDPLTDGYGQPLSWWGRCIGTVLVPWWVLAAIVFEAMAIRLDR